MIPASRYINSVKRVINRNRKLGIFSPTTDVKKERDALLAYITYPFYLDSTDPRFRSHINYHHTRLIAQVLNDAGYSVDAIDYTDTTFSPRKRYDLAIGIGQAFDVSHPHLNGAVKVYLSTGLHYLTANELTYQRHMNLLQRTGTFIPPARAPSPYYTPERSDAIISIQNRFTDNSYSHIGVPIRNCTISGTSPQRPLQPKTMNTRTILWLSGAGMVLKGLDLVLDAIADIPDCRLMVCADLAGDKEFEDLYWSELHDPNVTLCGFVDVGSPEFERIAYESTAIIFPYPEGEMSGSLVNAMNHGVIPVISYFSNNEIARFAVRTSGTVRDVRQSIEQVMDMSDEEIASRSRQTLAYAHAYYNPQAEYADWMNAIMECEAL